MTAKISVPEAQAWAEGTKLTIAALDAELEDHLSGEVITRLSSAGFVTTTWTNSTTTPKLVRTIISKLYVAWVYDRQYAEDIEQGSNYADRLKENANTLLEGLIAGTIDLPESPTSTSGEPAFYPTDASSALEPTSDDPSLGPAAFSMGMRF